MSRDRIRRARTEHAHRAVQVVRRDDVGDSVAGEVRHRHRGGIVAHRERGQWLEGGDKLRCQPISASPRQRRHRQGVGSRLEELHDRAAVRLNQQLPVWPCQRQPRRQVATGGLQVRRQPPAPLNGKRVGLRLVGRESAARLGVQVGIDLRQIGYASGNRRDDGQRLPILAAMDSELVGRVGIVAEGIGSDDQSHIDRPRLRKTRRRRGWQCRAEVPARLAPPARLD